MTTLRGLLTAALLGVIQGLTEFLPVSSTGHLTIAEKMLWLSIDDPAITAYTAVIQMGAIAAVLAISLLVSLVRARTRGRLGQALYMAGNLPLGVPGVVARGTVAGSSRVGGLGMTATDSPVERFKPGPIRLRLPKALWSKDIARRKQL